MTTANKYYIDRDAQPCIRDMLYGMVFKYLTGEKFDLERHAFREVIYLNWQADRMNTPAYVFLSNFVHWLEDHRQFTEDEEFSYQRFCDKMSWEMDDEGWFDDGN